MQTSGTFPQLSDNVKKTVVRPVAAVKAARPTAPAKAPKGSSHRAGGHAKHARGGKC